MCGMHPHLFKLDDKKLPTAVAGVPPDYFSKTGQRWGNPVYNWEALKKEHYHWWIRRIGHNLEVFRFAADRPFSRLCAVLGSAR